MNQKNFHHLFRIACAFLVTFTFAFGVFAQNAFATNVTQTHTSLTLGNSNPGTATTYTLGWTPADTTDTVKTVTIQFATSATGTTVVPGLAMGATPTVTQTGFSSATVTGAWTSSTNVLVLTLSTATAPSGAVTFAITNVTNPNAGVFFAQITSDTATPTVTDYGVAVSETVANVVVTGTMNQSLTFTVAGVASATGTGTTNGMNATTVTTTATTVPFGTFTAATTAVGSQLITTTTNAAYGYTVSLQENAALTYGASTIPDFSGTWTNGTSLGFGVNASAGTNADVYTTNFSGATAYASIAHSPSTLELAAKSGVTNASGDSEYINYQAEVSAAQAAGTYTNSVNYVVVPVY